MTPELQKMIEDAHKEELADINKYMKMSDIAKDNGNYCICGILKDIVHDEKSHAKILEYILETEV